MTREMPDSIVVVVATYNRPEHVRACLDHLQAQTRAPDEIFVVDASPNGTTADVVDAYPEVKYLRNEAGVGTTSHSRALGVAASSSEVIAFVDDDAYAEPSWLAELLPRYVDPSVGAVGGRARNGQPGEAHEGVQQIGMLLPDGRLTGNFAADPGRDLDVDHLLGANFSVRRSALESIGGIHEHYPGTCLREESDTTLRLAKAGFRIVFVPTAVVDHQPGPYASGERFDLRYDYFAARNHVVLLTTALGWSDPHTRAYARTAGGNVAAAVRYGLTALADSSRPNWRARVRGFGRGMSRAVVSGSGTMVGTVTSVSLTLKRCRDHRARQ